MNKISIKVIDSPRVDYEGLRFLSQEIFRIEKRSILNFFKPAEFYANVKNFLKAFFLQFSVSWWHKCFQHVTKLPLCMWQHRSGFQWVGFWKGHEFYMFLEWNQIKKRSSLVLEGTFLKSQQTNKNILKKSLPWGSWWQRWLDSRRSLSYRVAEEGQSISMEHPGDFNANWE